MPWGVCIDEVFGGLERPEIGYAPPFVTAFGGGMASMCQNGSLGQDVRLRMASPLWVTDVSTQSNLSLISYHEILVK